MQATAERRTAAGRCPDCPAAGLTGWKTGKGTLLLRCAGCNRVLHEADLDDVAVYRDDGAPEAATWPQDGAWRWLALLKGGDGAWLPVGLAETRCGCMDLLESGWVRGDLACVQVRADEGSGKLPDHFCPPPARSSTPQLLPAVEHCARCGPGEVTTHWRTLRNGVRRLESRCARCRRRVRTMRMTPQLIEEANGREDYDHAAG